MKSYIFLKVCSISPIFWEKCLNIFLPLLFYKKVFRGDISVMVKRTLSPRSIIDLEGNIAYAEGFQAWNLIRLKKEIIDEFPQLREKRSKFKYRIVFHRTYEELLKAVKRLKSDEVMPMLMFLYRED